MTRAAFVVVALVFASSCGGGDNDDSVPAQQSETSQPAEAHACDVLTKQQVEEALGVAELTVGTEETHGCAYGTQEDEAQVTFSVGILVGGQATFDEGLASMKEGLGEERVREFSGIAEGAYAADTGSGSFFAQAFDGEKQISLYIYVAPEIPAEEIFAAAETMLGAAAPNL